MFIIATDEAGYGPKLGPLVIAASTWQVQLPSNQPNDEAALSLAFAPLTQPVAIGKLKVRIDDSKAIFKSGSGLDGLHAIVCASHMACGKRFGSGREMIEYVADTDFEEIFATPWLNRDCSSPLLDDASTANAIAQWQSTGCLLLDVKARVITAKRFNQFCNEGANKADLLSRSTLQLVRNSVEATSETDIRVFCDRHGGRRYYAGVIAHIFHEGSVAVVSESQSESVYRCDWQGKQIRLAFTVKGDRFTPVAMSSLHAKYLRERMMASFNLYFAENYVGESPLKPTAGYPVDADRFLTQTAALRQQLKIIDLDLVRQR
ncbi:hypothetical protein N9N28_13275 [Rubripirellula amarantea]|uniref:Uncharacterized protein n=1 Tax=Rubripirellula amarantea TaxID=2527999 RepID=A0A5C5WTX8_9BACT|nr:hypothetical protein [Rubripirellula amarantea]MDA8745597.1 hypothetical protein [Rubripirellula amarantea]TWT54136.1 hypothetical protein Pla22_17710 [Rubripirellula amarantea]